MSAANGRSASLICVRAAIVLAIVLGGVASANAQSTGDHFVDTRISFVFSDDNVLADPGETLINSPQPDFGPRQGNFFPFENLNTRDEADVTLAHLVVYKELPGFIYGLVTDAALVARLEVLDQAETNARAGSILLSDGGSYLRARYMFDEVRFDPDRQLTLDSRRQLELTFFPMNADRFRAGFTYDLSWGGNSIFTDRSSRFATPGVRLRFDWDGFYALVGAKSTRQLILEEDPQAVSNRELGAFWGGIAGLGYVGDMFAVEANGGVFDAGDIPKQGIQGKPVVSYGGSLRVSAYSDGFGPERSIEYRLYRPSQNVFVESNFYLRKPKIYDEFTWRAQLEGTALAQTLGDFDNPGSTKTQPAFAGAAQFDMFIGALAASVDVVVRDLPFILFNVPSLDPFQSLPKDAEWTPELMLALRAEYWLEQANLLPSILVGVQFPAAYRGRAAETTNPSNLVGGEQTVIVPNAGTIIPFPNDDEPLEVYSVRPQIRWDLSDMMSFIAQVTYIYDRNQLAKKRDPLNNTAVFEFRDPNVLGFAFFAQARF